MSAWWVTPNGINYVTALGGGGKVEKRNPADGSITEIFHTDATQVQRGRDSNLSIREIAGITCRRSAANTWASSGITTHLCCPPI